MTSHEIYLAVFNYLDDFFFEKAGDDDALRSLLSDMDPYLFGENQMPADMAVWEDWEQCVKKVCGKDKVMTGAQIKLLLFAFLAMYRDEWKFDLARTIFALQNDPNLDRDLEQYAAQEE